MAAPTYTVLVYFDFPFAATAFTLNDPVRGVLNGTTYKLYSATPVDISADVTSVTINRGQESQLFPDVVAGTAVVNLNNDEGCSLGPRTYDPLNSSSPYFGNIIPGRRVDIYANGLLEFTGRVQDWNFSYDVSGRSIATLMCADGLATLARQELDSFTATASQLPGARISAILDRSEVQWPYARDLDTGVSVLQGDTVPFGTNVLQYLNTVVKSDVGMMYVSRDGVLTFKDRHAALNSASVVSFGSGTPYLSLPGTAGNYASTPDSAALDLTGSLEIVARVRADDWTAAVGQRIFSKVNGASVAAGGGYEMYVSSLGTLDFQYSTGAASVNLAALVPLADATTYWLKVTFNAGTSTATFYYAPDAEMEPTTWTTAGSQSGAGVPSANAIVASIGAMTGLSREFAGRIYRVIVRNGIGGTIVLDADFSRGLTSSGTTSFNEYSSNAATVTINTSGTSPATAVVPSGIPYVSIQTSYGSELLFNRIAVNNAGFGPNTTLSLASQAIYGISSYSTPTLLLNSSAQMTNLGAWLAGTYSDPSFRVTSITVAVHALTATQQAQLLGLDLSSVCTVAFRPNETGAKYTRKSLVVGIRDEMLPGSHMRTISFADIDTRAFFQLNDSVFGVLDTDLLAF